MSELRRQLWDLLPQLSDLSAATNSVMSLLAHLYGSSAAAGCTANGGGDSSSAAAAAVPMTEDDVAAATDELTQLVPRLWPFVRHMLSTVRGSVMQCLERMLAAAVTPPPPGVAAAAAAAPAAAWADAPPPLPAVASPPRWLQPLLPGLLQLVFQNVLVESEPRVQEASVRVWRLLVAAAAPAALRDLVSQEQLRALIQLATTQVCPRALAAATKVVTCVLERRCDWFGAWSLAAVARVSCRNPPTTMTSPHRATHHIPHCIRYLVLEQ